MAFSVQSGLAVTAATEPLDGSFSPRRKSFEISQASTRIMARFDDPQLSAGIARLIEEAEAELDAVRQEHEK
jgi:hypothetical protein